MEDERAAEVARDLLNDSQSRSRMERFRYEGSSMHPFLIEGDILTVARDRPPVVGDTVVFESEGAFVAHRYLIPWRARGASFLLTKADNRLRFDPLVAPARIVGPVKSVRRVGSIDCITSGAAYRLRAIAVVALSAAEGALYSVLRMANRRLRVFAGPRARAAAERIVCLPRTAYRLFHRGVA